MRKNIFRPLNQLLRFQRFTSRNKSIPNQLFTFCLFKYHLLPSSFHYIRRELAVHRANEAFLPSSFPNGKLEEQRFPGPINLVNAVA
jgi:hypothetical protein